jgi:serine/threonine-protein kinase HipA
MVNSISDSIFVWVWLPGDSEPIPCGVLRALDGSGLSFHYGDRYLDRADAISLYGPELPLERKWFEPRGNLGMPGALRDSSPDHWGRTVIVNRLTGRRGEDVETTDVSEAEYLLNSGSDRIGALDFQASPSEYLPRNESASLETLHQAADRIASGESLPTALAEALLSGTAIGGAQPKAVFRDETGEYIAKFPTTTSPFNSIGAEAAATFLAGAVGIPVPDTRIIESLGKRIFVSRRFDRTTSGGRRLMVSGLTMMGLDELTARTGSYPKLLDVLRELGSNPDEIGRHLFRRIAFNMAISNNDDHARNHAAFWDGKLLTLTPAYDLTPGQRSGHEMQLAMAYGNQGERIASFSALKRTAPIYGISGKEAATIVDDVIGVVTSNWDEAADHARLTALEKQQMWNRQFLNPGCLYDM